MYKTVWKEDYDIQPPKEILVGDSAIVEKVLLSTASVLERRKVYQRVKIPKTWKGKLAFRKDVLRGTQVAPVYSVSIYVAHKDYIDTYAAGSYYPSAVRKGGERIMETKNGRYQVKTVSHEAEENGKAEYRAEFENGGDGFFGNVIDCFSSYGFLMTVDLPDPVIMSEQSMRDTLAHLFRCPEIREGQKHG